MAKIKFWKIIGVITAIIFLLNLSNNIISKITQQTLLIIILLTIIFGKHIKKWLEKNIDFTI